MSDIYAVNLNTINDQRASYDTHIEEFLNEFGHNPQGYGIIDGSGRPRFYPTMDDVKSEYPTIDEQKYGTKPLVIDIANIRRECGIDGLLLTQNSGVFVKVYTKPLVLGEEYNIQYVRPEDVPLVLEHNASLNEQSLIQESASIEDILNRR